MTFEHLIRRNFIKIVDAYAEATGVSRSHVSKEFYGRGSFVEDYRQGRATVSVDKLGSVLAEIGKRWPKDAARPFLPLIQMLPR